MYGFIAIIIIIIIAVGVYFVIQYNEKKKYKY